MARLVDLGLFVSWAVGSPRKELESRGKTEGESGKD